MADKYANVKVIFWTEALNACFPKTNLEYKHKLKYLVNQFKELYNTKITRDMVKMYENNDEAFEKISSLVERIGEEFSKISPSEYAILLEVLEKFNSGELIKKQTK
jgi:tRNA isopentenyl-2-thiomethyl-A-37 hydroxylase MiaE